jgi:hypothetical protein
VIAVELRKLARRPRTWATLVLLDGLPVLVAVLLKITKLGPRPGQGPTFLAAVLSDGRTVPGRGAGHRASAVPAHRRLGDRRRRDRR